MDFDKLTLQRDLATNLRKLHETEAQSSRLEEQCAELTTLHNEALQAAEFLNSQLKEERAQRLQMEQNKRNLDVSEKKLKELQEIISDLRSGQFSPSLYKLPGTAWLKVSSRFPEKALLLQEQSLLISNQLTRAREREWSVRLRGNGGSSLIASASKRNGLESWTEMRLGAESLHKSTKFLDDMRVAHAELCQELDKTREILKLQEQINKDYKDELQHLGRKVVSIKNEYVASSTQENSPDDEVDLSAGQNLVELGICSALLNVDCFNYLRSLSAETPEEAPNVMAFAAFDFFDFGTLVSPIGMGLKPVFAQTFHTEFRFRVAIVDFFLHYLQSKAVCAQIYRSIRTESFVIATCNITLKDLLDTSKNGILHYCADLISADDRVDSTIRSSLMSLLTTILEDCIWNV
ncbi:hypothetical protein M427DRAFT_495138 [Gonapodya prolifera JEL478]|uniref:RPGR-interacting protein 1 first C2 domain-containing protein n=1 Tax=Gonapodya prolifera (strain JEL478) TaxID=1344416 RepID=A0A138ZWE0_GONPJ|nr:hypothetical protein M427DRAFT_495138 [Gonapodya prolifera JEL478]|eukprot:KXS08828.1 hypothetical protein M427DRAFT_495138 [Gonapodya prolifera JEL478]